MGYLLPAMEIEINYYNAALTAKGEITMTTVKQLKQEAKAMGIKGYSKMNKQQLEDAIMQTQQQAASEASGNTTTTTTTDNDIINNYNDDEFFIPDPQGDVQTVQQVRAANEVSRNKLIEYVKGDNTQVCFYCRGKKVRVYLDDNNKIIIHSERRGRQQISYQGLIMMFKPFTNGVHGDVALVVKNIVRIKNLMVVRQQKLVADARKAPAQATMEKAQTTKRTQGKVDPQWMQRLVEWFLETEGRRPTGLEIRNEWIAEQEQRRA